MYHHRTVIISANPLSKKSMIGIFSYKRKKGRKFNVCYVCFFWYLFLCCFKIQHFCSEVFNIRYLTVSSDNSGGWSPNFLLWGDTISPSTKLIISSAITEKDSRLTILFCLLSIDFLLLASIERFQAVNACNRQKSAIPKKLSYTTF